MPNWCNNSITISHPDVEKIDAIEKELTKSDMDSGVCNLIRPRPATEEDNWYDWNLENWGSKWDLSISTGSYERDGDTISFDFDTAWSPPIALYEYMVDQGYDVRAYYHEPGMCYCGKFEDGCDYFYEYDWTRDSIEELPEDLLDFTGLLQDYDDYESENEEEVD